MATGTRTRHGNRLDSRCPWRQSDRRLAAALRSQGNGTDEPDDGADADLERRMESRGEEGDQHRTDDEDHFVQHGLECERGVQQRGTVQPQGPTRSYGGSSQAEANPDADCCDETHSQRPSQLYRRDQECDAEHVDQDREYQDPSLAHAISCASPERSNTAAASVAAAVSNPARANEPMVSDTSSTIPMPVIDIGSLATKPARLEGYRVTIRQHLLVRAEIQHGGRPS